MPVAALTLNFSPMPRIAPPPLGALTAGSSDEVKPAPWLAPELPPDGAPAAGTAVLGVSLAASAAWGAFGPRGSTSVGSFFILHPPGLRPIAR